MLTLAILLGLGAAAGTLVIRELSPLTWLLIKPFKCDLCMSWWLSVFSVLMYGFLVSHNPKYILCILPAMFVSMVALKLQAKLLEWTSG